jgi:hypothetical protein
MAGTAAVLFNIPLTSLEAPQAAFVGIQWFLPDLNRKEKGKNPQMGL